MVKEGDILKIANNKSISPPSGAICFFSEYFPNYLSKNKTAHPSLIFTSHPESLNTFSTLAP